MRYENLHKHTMYSNIMTPDCIIKVEDIAKRAVELGQKSLSTVEHGYAGNVFEYYDVAKKYNLKLVFGVEFYYVHDRLSKDRTNAHLLILAKNNKGKKQLTKLISEANKTGFYYKPRIDKSLLFSLDPNDVVVTSTCIASPYNLYKDECFIIDCYNYFGENFYLEIHDNTNIKQIEYNKMLLEMHNKYDIPFIFATDTHYIHEEDAKYRDLLLRGKGINYPEEDGFIMDYPDSEKVFERFEKQGVFTRKQVEDSLRNTWIVDDFEEIVMTKDIKMPSIYPNLTHEQKMDKLKNIINEEWKKDREHIPKDRHKEYIEAIKFETDIIEKTSTEDYFLLNYPIIKRAKELGGVLTRTGRGSAPSYYLNKLLGFTEVDRLDAPVTLYPTRFMSISRILETRSLPDIDFNTADPKPFIQATKEILGEDNCYWMTAYGTMKESEAFRNLCRAYDIPMNEFNEVGKDLESYKDHSRWKDIIEESKKFIGVIDSVSPHPCANLLMSEPISEEVGIIKVGDEYCALIDSDTSDKWKFLKNDYLTVTVWRIISEGFRAINKPIPDVRKLSNLVENDESVWKLYEEGLTATLNQAGTDSGTPQVMQYKPKSIRELTGWVSAIRPQFSSMKSYFLNRKPFSYNIPEFDAILKESDNFILYQENIMATLVYAGFPEDETYGLLKAIAKKKEGIIEPIHDKFIKGFIQKTGNEEQALKVWKIIEDAVGYGFNSSHAYSVALDSIYGAYLKAKYPLEYYSTVLNIYENSTSTTAKLIKELDHFNIKILPIQFGKSRAYYNADNETNSIYKGIASIKYLNGKIAEELYGLAKNKQYEKNDFVSLLVDIFDTSVNSRQMETLIRLDFFREFGEKEVLLELYLCMSGKKKANIELYPQFDHQIVIDRKEKKNKKTGQVTITEKEKTIKKPLKYDAGLSEKTKIQRLKNLKEYEEAVRSYPPQKIDLYDQIAFEKDSLGYAFSTWNNVDGRYALVLDINKKYTPKVTLYQIKTGREFVVKVNKKKFWTFDDQLLYEGDIIKVLDVEEKYGWKNENGKWKPNPNVKELHLNKCQLVRKSLKRNR
ncbi:PHP domain-containing protein [Bacillus haynesii]|uniref:PHP domain-containing protein n=1 Tax=Bacillus haynesii TaxID=1925021 RepID=UPI002281F3B5|nr:PHP domain-containing protein [Bacillus haynesii]MCY8549281.1 PHP domain-containing protein [Bacillus haynesii]